MRRGRACTISRHWCGRRRSSGRSCWRGRDMKFLITATLLAFSLSPSSAMAQEKEGDYSALMAALGMKQLNGEELEQAIAEAEAFPLGSDRNPVRVDGP